MKRILVVALALVALMAFASCDPNMGGGRQVIKEAAR